MSSSSFARSLEFAKPLVDQIAEQKEQALQKETLTATAPTPLVSATPSPLVSKPPSPLPLPLSTSQDRIGLVVSTEPADSNFGGSKGKLFDDLFHINETDDEKTKELKRKLRDRVKVITPPPPFFFLGQELKLDAKNIAKIDKQWPRRSRCGSRTTNTGR